MIIAELSGRRRQSPNRELKQQTFSAQRRQPEVTLTSDSRFPPLWLAVATRRQRHIACFENVRFFFSSLPERQVFLIINTLFQDCPSLFLPGWPPNKRKFFILFRFCTKSCCTNDRQILQLFFIMKGAELFYE